MKASVLAKRSRKTIKPTSPERVHAILEILRATYPNVVCALAHRSAWELTVATILSAQCTDTRVNMVTPELFRRFPTPAAMATASQPEIEELVRTTGFFRNKAKAILGAANLVSAEFGGEVPQTMEQMLRIPGVARKTANVVLGSWFRLASGVVVDTHVLRLSRRLELTKQTTPEKVETDLAKIIPKDRGIDFAHELIHHGRQICIARKPRCADCTLERYAIRSKRPGPPTNNPPLPSSRSPRPAWMSRSLRLSPKVFEQSPPVQASASTSGRLRTLLPMLPCQRTAKRYRYHSHHDSK